MILLELCLISLNMLYALQGTNSSIQELEILYAYSALQTRSNINTNNTYTDYLQERILMNNQSIEAPKPNFSPFKKGILSILWTSSIIITFCGHVRCCKECGHVNTEPYFMLSAPPSVSAGVSRSFYDLLGVSAY